MKDPYFLKRLGRYMDCQARTTRKRLGRALEYGFLDEYNDNEFLIRSHRKMFRIAMDDAQRRFDDNTSNIPPKVFFKSDREYTRAFDNWVIPDDLYKTKSLLYGVQAVQGNPLLRGRFRHGKLINNHRNTAQRLSKNSEIFSMPRHLIMDVHRMLVDPNIGPYRSVEVFLRAEQLYRKLGHPIHGRRTFIHRFIKEFSKSFLCIQLPNYYISHLDLKEVPATREVRGWLRSRKDSRARGVVTQATSKLPGWPEGKFVTSRDRGCFDNISKNAIQAYTHRLEDILDVGECFDFILTETGSTGIRNVSSSRPRVWRDKSALPDTPTITTSSLNQVLVSL